MMIYMDRLNFVDTFAIKIFLGNFFIRVYLSQNSRVKRLTNELLLGIARNKKGAFISCPNVWTENVNMDRKVRIGMISTQKRKWRVSFL